VYGKIDRRYGKAYGRPMNDDEVLAEISTWHLRGRVYYRHESGPLFSASLLTPGGLSRAPQLEAELPEGAELYAPRPGSPAEARLDTWTDLVDDAVEQARLDAGDQLATLGAVGVTPCR
jgi:hypothetical protein